MNRLITIGVIITLILAFSFWGIYYARDTADTYHTMIKQAEILSSKQDTGALLKLANKMDRMWSKREILLSFYVRHDDLDKMGVNLSVLKSHIGNKDYKNINLILQQLDYVAEHIYEKELLNLNNLF